MQKVINYRLKELNGSGYEIADGQPNIEGWTIKDANGRRVGIVDDMLFDPELQKVRYLVASLKGNEFGLDRRKVLIPVGMAELHEKFDDVLLPSIATWQLRALPTYRSNELTEDDETDVLTVFSSEAGSVTGSTMQQKLSNFYEHKHFRNDNFYRKRNPAQATETSGEGAVHILQPRHETFQPASAATSATPVSESHQADEHRTGYPQSRHESGSDSSVEERLLTRVKKLENELEELEREIRNMSRDGDSSEIQRGDYI